jgi:hypothetical protein
MMSGLAFQFLRNHRFAWLRTDAPMLLAKLRNVNERGQDRYTNPEGKLL